MKFNEFTTNSEKSIIKKNTILHLMFYLTDYTDRHEVSSRITNPTKDSAGNHLIRGEMELKSPWRISDLNPFLTQLGYFW